VTLPQMAEKKQRLSRCRLRYS